MSHITADIVEQQVSSDIQACEALLKLLDREQNALKSREIDDLDEIIQNKTIQLSILEKSAIARREWVQLSGLKSDPESWQQILEEFNRPSLIEKWQHLKTLMDDCKSANEINGKLLSRSQEVFSRISGILRGQNQNVSLYGSSGRSTSGGNTQKFGEA